MAATSQRGATGFLRQCELKALLRRANASPGLSAEMLKDTLQAVESSDEMKRSVCPRSALTADQTAHPKRLLDAQLLMGLLLRLCTMSQSIAELFQRHAINGQMGVTEWLNFCRDAQLQDAGLEVSARPGSPSICDAEDDEAELADAKQQFERAATNGGTTADINKLDAAQFALHLLAPLNSAV
eukprot:6369394-Prymnesium_polylepis.1